MNGVLNLAEQILINQAIGKNAPFTDRNKMGISFALISTLFVIMGFAFLLYAGFVWLQNNFPREEAAVIIGLAAMAIAICNGLVAYGVLRYKRKRIKDLKNEMIQMIEDAINYSDEELAEPVRQNPKTSVLIASVAGFLAGERFL